MVYDFIGRVINVGEKSGVSQKGTAWRSWEVVIEHEQGQYPKRVLVSVWDENVWNTIAFAKQSGDAVKVACNIDCREYNGRWFNDIKAWKAELAQQTTQPMQQQAPVAPMQQNAGFTAPAQPMPTQSSNPTIFDGTGTSVQGNADTGELPF